MISPLFINAGWELKGPGRVVCRWFVCWKILSPNEFSGTIAGYSGGGSFQVENFYAKTKKKAYQIYGLIVMIVSAVKKSNLLNLGRTPSQHAIRQQNVFGSGMMKMNGWNLTKSNYWKELVMN